ncbi:MAG: hypothetical protein GEV11_17265 [Streptosporangiales bacterium]|nr:hypothetical protein [Streptosporangiales bacterium]
MGVLKRLGRLALVSLLAGGLAYGLAGCGGGEGTAAHPKPAPVPPAPVPEDFVLYRGAGFTVAHPEGWKVTTGRDDSGAQVVKIVAPGEGGPKDDAELLIGRLPGFKGDFANRIVSFRSSAELAGRKIVAQRPMFLPGATQAWRLDLSYRAPDAKDAKDEAGPVKPEDTIRMENLQVLGRDRTLTEVAVRARQDAFGELGLSRVLPTFRLT